LNHWIILPVVLPLVTGAVLLLLSKHGPLQRPLSVAGCALLTPLAIALLSMTVDNGYGVYALGNWPAPYGIVLVLDRLSALLLLLTALVALASLVYALLSREDANGPSFHPLFQFQLLGLNCAFLTGDLFNLFVSFEILLIASYGLLLHGGGGARSRAGLHYVVLNLAGSALCLIGIGVIYGITGTLNMADLAVKVAATGSDDAALLRAGALILLVVFGLKAALLPLYFWLPEAYSRTSPAVAALFAIMTKVGVYAIVRVFTLIFGQDAAHLALVAQPWLLPLALATLAAGAFGVLASTDLRRLLAYAVVVSVGTLLIPVALFSSAALSAALMYLIHSTLITAALFLLADPIIRRRGSAALQQALPMARPALLGTLFFAGAISIGGLPPLSGFVAKLMILQAAIASPAAGWIWAVILITSLMMLIALARAGSQLFWSTAGEPSAAGAGAGPLTMALPAAVLLLGSPLLVLFGAAVADFTAGAAQQLINPAGYIESVLPGTGTAGKPSAGDA
jgi:multicomponent K+:H+ antiporter subunit D